MMDIAKSETFKNFIILNKALLFLIKLSKTAVQSVLKLFRLHSARCAEELFCVQEVPYKLKASKYRDTVKIGMLYDVISLQ